MADKIDLSRLDEVAAKAMVEKGPLADLASDWEHDQREAILLCAAEDAGRAIMSEIKKMGYVIVPSQPTKEMLEQAEEMYMPFGEMRAAWDGFMIAAPKLEE